MSIWRPRYPAAAGYLISTYSQIYCKQVKHIIAGQFSSIKHYEHFINFSKFTFPMLKDGQVNNFLISFSQVY